MRAIMLVDGEWAALCFAIGQHSVYVANEQNSRAILRLADMGGDEMITIMFLFVEASGESKRLKSVLQVCADAVDASFGVGAGVDVDNGFEVVEVFVHVFLGSFYVMVFHITPSSLNFSI